MEGCINTAWTNFLSIRKADPNCRDASYEHCRQFFIENHTLEEKRDEIALHLFAYLASWGMLRNSFISQKDYLFHRIIVDILCKEEYSGLLNWEPLYDDAAENDSKVSLVIKLKKEIKKAYLQTTYYPDATGEKKSVNNVTDTLLSKIILGTFGCTPAYDEYFVCGLDSNMHKSFSENSLKEIIAFAKKHKEKIEDCKKKIESELGVSNLYTTMKVVDILLWGKGAQIKKKKS